MGMERTSTCEAREIRTAVIKAFGSGNRLDFQNVFIL